MIDVKVNTSGVATAASQISAGVHSAEVILATQIMKDTRPFVPFLTGNLNQRVHLEGTSIVYPGPYARYLYYGVKMVDAETGRGPVYIEDVGFRFRKGAHLMPTTIPLNYTKTHHPQACSHWFEASKAVNLPKWIKVAGKAVSNGK